MPTVLPTNTDDPWQNFINWFENELSQIFANFGPSFQYTPAQVQQAATRAAAGSPSGSIQPGSPYAQPFYSAAVPFTMSPGTGTVSTAGRTDGSGSAGPESDALDASAMISAAPMVPIDSAGAPNWGGPPAMSPTAYAAVAPNNVMTVPIPSQISIGQDYLAGSGFSVASQPMGPMIPLNPSIGISGFGFVLPGPPVINPQIMGRGVLPGPPPINPQIPHGYTRGPVSSEPYMSPELPGMGQYIPTQSYLMTPAGQAGIRGLGGLGCGCGCGGGCGCSQPGMGTLGDGTGFLGTGLFNGSGMMGSGLFEGGFDPSAWGPAEWATIAIGAYVAWSVFFTTKAGIGYASTVPARTKRAARSVKSSFL